MNGRRALQIGLMLVMAVFLVEMFTPLHAANCSATVKKTKSSTNKVPSSGTAGDNAPVAFQVHGGDNTFSSTLRARFADELKAKFPERKLLDGPPGRNGVLVVFTLKADDARWTPFYSHEGLGIEETVQIPKAPNALQVITDADVDAVCTGLVSRAHFQLHDEVTSSIAPLLVEQLQAALGEGTHEP